MKAIDWPFGDNGASQSQGEQLLSISDYLAQRKLDLVINLPLRQHRYVSIHLTLIHCHIDLQEYSSDNI